MKVVWSREEDIQHDMYRPYYYDRLSAGLDAAGKPVAWTHRICRLVRSWRVMSRRSSRTVSIPMRWRARRNRPTPCRTSTSIMSASSRQASRPPSGVASARPTTCSSSRASSTSWPHAAKQDPVAYRKALLGHNPRALAVLNLAAEKAGWGQPLPARGWPRRLGAVRLRQLPVAGGGSRGRGRWLSQGPSHRRARVDCGIVVNPDTIAAQVEGGALFGLTAALYGAITLKNGRVGTEQLQRLSADADQRSAGDRDASGEERRSLPAVSARRRPPRSLRR